MSCSTKDTSPRDFSIMTLYVVCKRLNVIWLCCSFTSSGIAVQKLTYLAVFQPLMSELRQKYLLDITGFSRKYVQCTWRIPDPMLENILICSDINGSKIDIQSFWDILTHSN